MRSKQRLACVYAEWLSDAHMRLTHQPFTIVTSDIPRRWLAPLHWHDAYEIGYVIEGTGEFLIEDQCLSFTAGQVYVIPPALRHMAYADETARLFVVHFHPELLRDGDFLFLAMTPAHPYQVDPVQCFPLLPLDDPHAAAIFQLLRQIQGEAAAGSAGWPLITKGLLLHIVGLLVRHFQRVALLDAPTQRQQADRQRLAPALRLMESPATQTPTLAEMAATVHLSTSHFRALFRATFGVSPIIYRNQQRLLRAQEWLLTTDESITQISVHCGFLTIQQFNRLFLRQVGQTPGAYRRLGAAQATPTLP